MGFFDGSKNKQIEALEKELNKLWGAISYLQDNVTELNKRSPEHEKEAKQSSKKAAEYRNKAEQRFSEAESIVRNLESQINALKAERIEIENLKSEVSKNETLVRESRNRLEDTEDKYTVKLESLNEKVSHVDSITERYPDLDLHLKKIEEFSQSTEENLKKSSVSLTAINKRKEEIDNIHREIFGYTDIIEDEETHIEGLKEELENAYKNLSNKLDESNQSIDDLNLNHINKYDDFQKSHEKKYQKIIDDIASLLPDAMTAGLSSAFSKKREDEVALSIALQKRFTAGIITLIAVSSLVVALSIVFLYQEVPLEEVINRLPRLVLAIVPIYIPVLWFTYSANKKLNLSKRLIEEYSHKEVLSRTYEGLSNQIESIGDSAQSEELRFRLLSNFLQVSSENPGKLISNYEASDHPVMEALEQSYKFQLAIDRLEGVPGLNRVAAMMEKNAKRKLGQKMQKIDEALSEKENDHPNESEG